MAVAIAFLCKNPAEAINVQNYRNKGKKNVGECKVITTKQKAFLCENAADFCLSSTVLGNHQRTIG